MKNLETIQKKTAQATRSASTKLKAKAKRESRLASKPSVDGALGIIEAGYDKAKSTMAGFSLSKVAKAEYVVPVAIGSFVLGAAATALGMFLLPKIRQSDVYATVKDNIQNATASVSEGLATAIHNVKASMTEKTSALKNDFKNDPKTDTATRVS